VLGAVPSVSRATLVLAERAHGAPASSPTCLFPASQPHPPPEATVHAEAPATTRGPRGKPRRSPKKRWRLAPQNVPDSQFRRRCPTGRGRSQRAQLTSMHLAVEGEGAWATEVLK